MYVESIVELASQFGAGQLSGDEYLRRVDLGCTDRLPSEAAFPA